MSHHVAIVQRGQPAGGGAASTLGGALPMHTHGPAVPRAGTRLCGRGRETTDHRRPRQDTQDGGGQWEVRPGRCAGTGVALPGARDGPQRPVPKHAANLTKAPPPELRARGRPRARSVCPRKIVVPSRRELSVGPLGGCRPQKPHRRRAASTWLLWLPPENRTREARGSSRFGSTRVC